MALTMKRAAAFGVRAGSAKPVLPVRSVRALVVRAEKNVQDADVVKSLGPVLSAAVAASTLSMAGSAQAANEILTMAASDNRVGILATLFLPVLGWVGFNIFSGAKNQLDTMADKAVPPEQRSLRLKRGVVAPLAGLGLLAAAQSSEAATEVAQLAASDNRAGILLTLLVPVVGWVAFNIFSGAKNQLDVMAEKAVGPEGRSVRINPKKRAIMGPLLGLGLLAAAQSADAATEVAQLAAGDNRVGILATLFLPVLGWVGFNIFSGAKNQLDTMADKAVPPEQRSLRLKRGVVAPLAGMGLLAAAQSADAATEIAQLAASDNRAGILLTLLVPVLGWVAFNIFSGAKNQLDTMADKAVPPEQRSVRVNPKKKK